MTNEKFTPGPWRYEQGSRNPWAPCIVSAHRTEYGEETMVVNLQGAMGGDDVNADARLIAAAPELVEALRPFAEALDRAERNGARLVGVLCQWMEPGAEREYVESTSTCGPDDFERARALLARIGGEG